MIIMSVDYGDARTGVAVCDKNEILASPVKVIFSRRRGDVTDELTALAKELGAELIVFGMPRNMDGSYGFRAEACREAADELKQKTPLEVVTYDERLTTVMAHRALSENNVRGKKRKQTVDAVSAVMILEDYMKYRKNASGGGEIEP